MAGLSDFLNQLFESGRVTLTGPPIRATDGTERQAAVQTLREAFVDDLLDLAGPPVPFAEDRAIEAAEWTRRACWFVVSREEPPHVLQEALALPPRPSSEADHLAADLTFRYLPRVHRRAIAIDPDDPLATRLAELFRGWPLSGVLSDLDQGPDTPIDFGEHDGLWIRYAERLADRDRKGWEPAVSHGQEILEWVIDATERRGLLKQRLADGGGVTIGRS